MVNEKTRAKRVGLLCQALRSQKYPQCTHDLHSGKAHCALGIAEVVYCIENDITLKQLNKTRHEDRKTCLHQDVQKWYGFDSEDPDIKIYKNDDIQTVSTVRANDGEGLNFHKIADAFNRTYVSGVY